MNKPVRFLSQKKALILSFFWVLLYLFSNNKCMEYDELPEISILPKEPDSSKGSITLFNDTAHSIQCAWYKQEKQRWISTQDTTHTIHPRKKCSISYHGSQGIGSFISMTGWNAEPILIIQRSSEGVPLKKEMSLQELTALKKDYKSVIKDFLYSNWTGFYNGQYVISDTPRLKCISQKILSLYNKTHKPVVLCWYALQAGELYQKKSCHYSAAANKILEIPSYAQKGVQGVLGNSLFLMAVHSSQTEKMPLEDTLSKREIEQYHITAKDFSRSNWNHYNTKGSYYICLKEPLSYTNALACTAKPNTITIKNRSNQPIYCACYEKKREIREKRGIFCTIDAPEPFPYALWWTILNPKPFAPEGHILPLIDTEKFEICIATNAKDLDYFLEEHSKTTAKLPHFSHSCAYRTYEIDILGDPLHNPSFSIAEFDDHSLNQK